MTYGPEPLTYGPDPLTYELDPLTYGPDPLTYGLDPLYIIKRRDGVAQSHILCSYCYWGAIGALPRLHLMLINIIDAEKAGRLEALLAKHSQGGVRPPIQWRSLLV